MAEVNLDIAMESTSQEILNKVAEGVEVNFRTPIAMGVGYLSGQSGDLVNITGKGKLFVRTSAGTNTFTIVVDGVTILSSKIIGSDCPFEIEFTQSAKVTSHSSTANQTAGYVLY